MILQRILPFSKTLLSKALSEGDIAIDATVGHGHDTVFLAEQVGRSGFVYGFDIQQEAIESTEKHLQQKGLDNRVILFHKNHADLVHSLPEEVHGKVKAAVFNLGYLPRGDKTIVTEPETTCLAVEQLLALLQQGGLIVLVIYHGHPEGKIEKDAILKYVRNIDEKIANVMCYQYMNKTNDPPFIIAIEKN